MSDQEKVLVKPKILPEPNSKQNTLKKEQVELSVVDWAQIISAVVSTLALCFTALFGHQIYKLNKYDIDPNLEVYDACIEIADASTRAHSACVTEKNDFAIVDDFKGAGLTIVLRNLGKENVIISDKHITSNGLELNPYPNEPLGGHYLVPVGTNSPRIMSIDVTELVHSFDKLVFDYSIQYHSVKNSDNIKTLNFEVYCSLTNTNNNSKSLNAINCYLGNKNTN